MHEFGSVKECPKCGAGLLRREWQPQRREYLVYWKATGTGIVSTRPERHKVTCCSCGYPWYERTKDAGDDGANGLTCVECGAPCEKQKDSND